MLLVPGDYPRRGDDKVATKGGGVIEETVGALLPQSEFGLGEIERGRLSQ